MFGIWLLSTVNKSLDWNVNNCLRLSKL